MSEPRSRIDAIDIVRGIVMVLMAIDHVRVYSGQPAGGPEAGIFFTRWITHFCAPAFIFLAGTSAFLHGRALGSLRALRRFLVTRGLLLVVLELTVVRFFWTFNFDYASFTLAGVIWATGWSMVILGALVELSGPKLIGWAGVAIMVFQQAFGLITQLLPDSTRRSIAVVWNFIYPSGADGWAGMEILYTLVPWVGVMAAGYGFGAILTREREAWRRFSLRTGLIVTSLFGVIGSLIATFIAPEEGDAMPWLFRALNQQKYPATQLYLMMTLGPTLIALALLDDARGWIARVFRTFGRVPMFYYLLHIPVIHLAALAMFYARDGRIDHLNFSNAPYVWMPDVTPWGLGRLYFVFALVIVILYEPCRRFTALKSERRGGWLSYI